MADVIKKYVLDRIRFIFSSINAKGLVPLSEVEIKCISIIITGTHDTQTCISVQCIGGKSKKEQEQCIEAALWEEYTGVFGISLERIWPFNAQSSHPQSSQYQEKLLNGLICDEIKSRIKNNILFVLQPPPYSINSEPMQHFYNKDLKNDRPRIVKQRSSTTTVSFYKATDGLLTRAGYLGSGLLINPEKLTSEFTGTFNEIKTSCALPWDKVIKVLVPEPLAALAFECFPQYRGKLQIVSEELVHVKRLPDIIAKVWGVGLPADGVEIRVPSYKDALSSLISSNKGELVLHVVRLPTEGDVSIRIIEDLGSLSATLEEVGAKTLKRSGSSALVLCPKLFGMNCNGLLQNITEVMGGQKLRIPDRFNDLQKAIMKGTGKYSMFRKEKPATPNQELALQALELLRNVIFFKADPFVMIASHALYKELAFDENALEKLGAGLVVLSAAIRARSSCNYVVKHRLQALQLIHTKQQLALTHAQELIRSLQGLTQEKSVVEVVKIEISLREGMELTDRNIEKTTNFLQYKQRIKN